MGLDEMRGMSEDYSQGFLNPLDSAGARRAVMRRMLKNDS